MSEQDTQATGGGPDRSETQLTLVGMGAGSERLRLALVATDDAGQVLFKQDIGDKGRFSLPPEVLKRAHLVVLGAADGQGGVQAEAAITYRAEEFQAQIAGGTLALAEGIWSRFHFHWQCVSGSVQARRGFSRATA